MQNYQLLKLQKRLEKRFTYKTRGRRTIRYALLGANFVGLLLVLAFTLQQPHDVTGTTAVVSAQGVNPSANDPLDQLSAADIGLTVAQTTNLPETTAVRNQAQSVKAELASAPTENSVTSKPLVVATVYKSRQDIKTYTTQPNDTFDSLAVKFNITTQSIQWSNPGVNGSLTPGTNLLIPPVNGIVYTVKSTDSPQSLATKYSSNLDQLVAFNDAEVSGIYAGERIIIPNGQVPTAPTYNYYAKNVISLASSPVLGTYNGYDFGYCTWYVATQLPVPPNWGNASSWAYYASTSGWSVSGIPTVGSIAQTPYAAGGEGHVAIVTAVSADGSQIQYRDMNGIAGWDRVGYSGWVSASKYPHYISR